LVDLFGVGPLGLAADAEHSQRGFAGFDEVEGFCRGAQDAGALPLYYCAISELYRTQYLDSVAWWVADYGPNDGRYHDPAEQPPVPPADRPWSIHQFTSLGWPGGGSLDVNYAPNLDFAGAPATPLPKEQDVYLVRNRDTGTHTLYTALGATANVDETFANELAFSGVPRYDLPGGVADSLGLIHVGHYRSLVDAVASSDGQGTGTVTDAEAMAQVNALLAAGDATITGGQVTA